MMDDDRGQKTEVRGQTTEAGSQHPLTSDLRPPTSEFDEEQQLIHAAAAEIRELTIETEFSGAEALALCSLLQLALRHPELTSRPDSFCNRIAREFLEQIRAHLPLKARELHDRGLWTE